MKLLKIARIKKGISQKELAKNLNMSVATVNKIENNNIALDSIKLGSLKRICKALDITSEEFISIIEYDKK
ncbi:helix-turn-helix transcriptional regulator [Romboutsia timonensis]|uniref:helix-turn-helix domain-containing protein n=1 Tax=Romboutsia timonensis TaxID=1776391 RepID=UPI002A83421E|nr:helix-turn-helix transcriptional regulator [Romboutsia timonensis]MDY3960971.1 helix-turn-helix transcriptional regulator [Romboutsia timonensis]